MSIFSSCVGAPNSLVMTYIDTSEMPAISASPCPMPLVSTTIKSNPAALTTSRTSPIAADNSVLEPRVARLLMNTRLLKMAFMRMRSPRSAPPVFCFVGSIDRIAIFLSGSSVRKRRINSSVRELFPAPPVPVIPRTGVFFDFSRTAFIKSPVSRFRVCASSAVVMMLASATGFSADNPSSDTSSFAVEKSHSSTISAIMPCKPFLRPSSGEKMPAIP